jgi:NADH:ubiquinone reductase (H+-translocating)
MNRACDVGYRSYFFRRESRDASPGPVRDGWRVGTLPARSRLRHAGAECCEPASSFFQRSSIPAAPELPALPSATSEKALLKSGLEIPAKTIVSSVPSSIPLVLHNLDCEKEGGRLKVNANLELVGYEGNVWALGDCASITTISGKRTPATAQHATREAKTVSKNIAAAIHGGPSSPFAFEGFGKLGSLGHYSAVAEILGIRISGFPAWLLWRAIYLAKLPSLRQKVRIALDWFFVLLFPPDFVQLRVVRDAGIAR